MGSKMIFGDKDAGEIYEQVENGKFRDTARLIGGNFIQMVGNGVFEREKEDLLRNGARELTEEEYAMLMFSLSNTDGGLQIEATKIEDDDEIEQMLE